MGNDGSISQKPSPSPSPSAVRSNPFEPDVIDNIADSIVAEFKDMKVKALDFLPSWEDLIKDEEDDDDTYRQPNTSTSGDSGTGNFFGF